MTVTERDTGAVVPKKKTVPTTPSTGGKKPTSQPSIEAQYPNVAKWVKGYGWIEIGETEWQGFQVRALDAGGLIYEDADCDSFADAMQALETGLGAWFKEQSR